MTSLRKVAFGTLVLAEIIAQYVSIPWLKVSLGPIALVAWALAIVPADRTSKRISFFLLGVGALLMTTAGFIGTAVKLATAKGLPGSLASVVGNPVAFALIVPTTVVLLSIVGVHPQIGMVITYSLVASIARTFPAPYVCLALLIGAALGFNVSPVSATMLVLSSCAGTNSIEVGLKRHWKYALLVLPAAGLLLSAVRF